MSNAFEDIMSFHPDNLNVFHEIQEGIGQLIPFVGEELTANVFGTRRDMLLKSVRNLTTTSKRNAIIADIESGYYLEAAQKLEKERGRINLRQDLISHYAYNKIKNYWDDIKHSAAWLLPDLFLGPVLTTNFDEVIEEIYKQRNVHLPALDPSNYYLRDYARCLNSEPCIIKLHGTVIGNQTDYEKLVLTREQYENHYGETGDIRVVLSAFAHVRSMLFLGCDFYSYGNQICFPMPWNGTNYSIIGCSWERRDERIKTLANDYMIRAIVYPEVQRDALRTVLQRLVDDHCSRKTRPSYPYMMFQQPDEEDLIRQINAQLEVELCYSQSFKMLRNNEFNVDRSLYPNGIDGRDLIPSTRRSVKLINHKVTSLREFIEKSWQRIEREHLFVAGKGGIGKTVALLSFATEEDFLPKGVAAIYISLNKLASYSNGSDPHEGGYIDRYLCNTFSGAQFKKINDLSHEPWGSHGRGPNVILLLDGYNEVPLNRRKNIKASIEHWALRRGTQIVTTSRIDDSPSFFLKKLMLEELPKAEIETYLGKHDIAIPSSSNKLWSVIATPLMLKIYTDVEYFVKSMPVDYLDMRESDNAGHLIWNYLQRELYTCAERYGSVNNVEYAAAILLIMPYICWEMEYRYEFTLSRDEFGKLLEEACLYWHQNTKPEYFIRMERAFSKHVSDITSATFIDSQQRILTTETGLIYWNLDGYSLMHQNFRDGLAAVHLANVVETMGDILLQEFTYPLSKSVKEYLVDLLTSTHLDNIWKANRKMRKTSREATINLLDIIFEKDGGNLEGLDWSGMDLRGISLFDYRLGYTMMLSRKPESYVGTKISIGSFKPQGHTGPVECVTYNMNGDRIASASRDGTIRVWDSASHQQIGVPLGKRVGWMTSACFSPDGRSIVSGSYDDIPCVWSIGSGRKAYPELESQVKGVRWVEYDTDGGRIVGCTNDGCVLTWNAKRGSLIHFDSEGFGEHLYFSALSYDKTKIVACTKDGSLLVRSAKMRGLVYALPPTFGERFRAAAFNRNGTLIVSGSDNGTVRIWDESAHVQLGITFYDCANPVESVCFSPDGKYVAGGSREGTIYVWELGGQRRLYKTLNGHSGWVKSVCFSPDGKQIASGSHDGTVRIWDVSTGGQINPPLEGYVSLVRSVSSSREGGWVVSGSDDGTIRVWCMQTTWQKRILLNAHVDWVESVSISQDGKSVISGSRDGSVHIWDVETGKPKGPLSIEPHADSVESVFISGDGELAVSGSGHGVIRIWDGKTGRQIGMSAEEHSGAVTTVCLSPNKRLIASGSRDCLVRIWNASNGCLVKQLAKVHSGWVSSVCFNADGSLIASGSDDGTVYVWQIVSGECTPMTLYGRQNAIVSLCFSPNGRMIVGGFNDGSIEVWDVETGSLLRPPCKLFDNPVESLCFRSDGSIVSYSFRGASILMRSLTSIESVFTVSENEPPVTSIDVLFGADLTGLDFGLADVEEYDRAIFLQNGIKFSVKSKSSIRGGVWGDTTRESSIPRFRIGFTFTGKYREPIIRPVCKALIEMDKMDYTKEDVFLDEWHEPLVSGVGADSRLREIYHSRCDVVVVLLSPDYADNDWAGHVEWRAICDLINTGDANKICLLSVDDVDIGTINGLYEKSDKAMKVDGKAPKDIARDILKWIKYHPQVESHSERSFSIRRGGASN